MDKIRVRIDDDEKTKAKERAAEQDMSLSAGVRDLLKLWICGHVDLHELHDLPRLPTVEELHALGALASDVTGAIEAFTSAIIQLERDCGQALGMVEDVNAGAYFEPPRWEDIRAVFE